MNKMYANRYACMYKRADTAEDNVDTQFATEGNLLKNVEIFRTGVFREELFEADYIESMIDNFYSMKKSGVFANVPVRKGHQDWLNTRNSTDELIGYIKDVRVVKKGTITVKAVQTDESGEKIYNESGKAVRKSRKIDDVRLLADLEITEPEALEKITRTTWRDRSIEFGRFDDNNGNESYPVLMGVAFVDIPQVDQLASLFNFYSKRDFDVVGLDNKQLNLEKKEEIMPKKDKQSYKATPPQDEATEMEAGSSEEAITPIGEIYPEEEVKEVVVEEVVEKVVEDEEEVNPSLDPDEDESALEAEAKEIETGEIKEEEEVVEEEEGEVGEVTEEEIKEEETKEEAKEVETFVKSDFDIKEFEKLRRYKMKHERMNRDNYVNALVKAGFSTPAMGEFEKELIASFFAMEGDAEFRGAKQQFKLFKQLKESTPKVWEKKDDLQVTDDETPKKDLKEEAVNDETSSAEKDAEAARGKIEDAGLKAKES